MKYCKEDSNKKKVNWLQIKWLRYQKTDPDNIQFKYNFDEDFRILRVSAASKKRRQSGNTELPRKYTNRQAISAAKKKDLVKLCKTGVIPVEYHESYKSRPSNSNVADRLADTDVEEEEMDSD